MGQYTMADVQRELGKHFVPEAFYQIATHRAAFNLVSSGTHKVVGELTDFSLNETGTMKILQQILIPPPKPKPSVEAPPRAKPDSVSRRTSILRSKGGKS